MKKLLAVSRKEVRQAFRDPLSLSLLLGIPTMMLLLYGYAVNFDVKHIALAVQDLDPGRASRELVSSFVNSGYFDLVESVPAGADLAALTENRRAQAVLVIPERFSKDLDAGRTSPVQFLIDGTDANTATTILGYARAVTLQRNAEIRAELTGTTGREEPTGIRFEPRVWYNPELKSTLFLVPGLIGMILMLTAVLSTALSVVREKERGTMEQVRVSPIGTFSLILGKSLPYLVISLLATFFILVTARLLFGVVIHGPILDLFIATVVYLIGGLGLGLLVSTASESQAQAFQMGSTLSLLPAVLLSGFIFPIRGMPVVLQAITYFVPARYYLVVLRGVILKGAGLQPYTHEMLFLGGYAVLVLGLAVVRLSRQEA